MQTQISPMLAVSDGNAAIRFYERAFGAILLWRLGDEHVVAGLAINGAQFFLAGESPSFGTRAPASVGFTTVRIELFADDPVGVHRQAIAAGAIEHSRVEEHNYPTTGPHPIGRMLQGAVVDPFGHMWLIGRFLE
jgi:PhnB protein